MDSKLTLGMTNLLPHGNIWVGEEIRFLRTHKMASGLLKQAQNTPISSGLGFYYFYSALPMQPKFSFYESVTGLDYYGQTDHDG